MGGTGGFYTFRRAVFHEPQRATTTACPLACGLEGAHEPLGLVDERAARGAREALERAQGEGRLAALDLDRPRPGHEPVDQVAGTDLQVAPLVDGVAVLVGKDPLAALGGVGEQDAVEGGQQARRGRASRGRAAARRAGRRARGRSRPRSARGPRRGARTPRAPAACATRSSPPRRRGPPARTPADGGARPRRAPCRPSARRAGAGPRSRALGAFGAPGAVGRHPHEGRPALERAPLELALALELAGFESALGCSATHSSTNAPTSSALRGVRLA